MFLFSEELSPEQGSHSCQGGSGFESGVQKGTWKEKRDLVRNALVVSYVGSQEGVLGRRPEDNRNPDVSHNIKSLTLV